MNQTRGQIVIPQRPYLPHHRQSHLVNFISEDPVTFLQYTGVGGIPLMYAINKSFFGLIGRDDAMFANYAGPTISLRLEVGLASAHYPHVADFACLPVARLQVLDRRDWDKRSEGGPKTNNQI